MAERPKEPPNPYIYFKRKGGSTNQEKWNELSEEKKREYEIERTIEYLKYQRKLANYYELNPEGEDEEEESKGSKVGQKRKRKMSGYHLFQREQQEVLRKTGEGKNFLAHCSYVWNQLDEKTRADYTQRAAEENEGIFTPKELSLSLERNGSKEEESNEEEDDVEEEGEEEEEGPTEGDESV